MQKQGNTEKYENDKYHKLHHDRTFPSITRCLLLDWLLRLRHQGSALPQPGATQVYVYNDQYICLVPNFVQILNSRTDTKHSYTKDSALCGAPQICTIPSACACVQNYKYGLIYVQTKVQIHALQIAQYVSIPKTPEHKTQPFLSQRQQNAPSRTTILWMPSCHLWFEKYKIK